MAGLSQDVEVDADAPFSFEEDDNTVLAPLRTTEFWRSLSSSPGQADAISEWTKLAQLVLVQVHGSCEDERMFSAMSYLKNKYRNKLDEPHLNLVARFFHQQWCNYNASWTFGMQGPLSEVYTAVLAARATWQLSSQARM